MVDTIKFASEALPDHIAAALTRSAGARGVFGASLSYFSEVGSTNDLALRAAEQGAAEGTVFVAEAQTAGRGRLGRVWFSPPGAGLYVSVILRRAPTAPWITLAGGAAVAEGIRYATALPVELKWPNDVVIAGQQGFRARRKLAGILAEAATAAGGDHYIVLGFGINLRKAILPPELLDRATSIEAELGRMVPGGDVLAGCLMALNTVCEDIDRRGVAGVLDRWLEMAPSASGARVEWDGPSGRVRGVTNGLALDGALLVRTATGVERILSGEVRWL